MMRIYYLVLLLLAALASARNGPMGKPAQGMEEVLKSPPGRSFWPQPQQLKLSNDLVPINVDNFKIETNLKNCSILSSAISRYNRGFFDAQCQSLGKPNKKALPTLDPNVQAIDTLEIIVTDTNCPNYPPADVSEFYTLMVAPNEEPNSTRITIGAFTVWGALRGLETLSQAIFHNDTTGHWSIYKLYILDYPRFSFRGLLLDTSRHYLPVSILKSNLDAMEMNKLNVFHWHIVDDTSFPYVSTTFPKLSEEGAFDNETHIYTPSDVQDIINYAAERGIRIIPEFDTPGHTLSWGPGQPGLLTPCYKEGKPDGTYGPINPILISTYKFLQSFMSEITNVFKDSYFHIGGDEVVFKCWESNPDITEFMKKQGFGTDYAKLESFYITRLLGLMKDLKRNTIVWQEVFENNEAIGNDTIVHVWIGKDDKNELARATEKGHHVIFSSQWYLNYISYGQDWDKYYLADPHNFTGSAEQKKLVMGGEACMWGEFVDGTNVISRTWPRASAVAERLWSSADLRDLSKAVPRMEAQRCRMLKRGIRVEPTDGPSFCVCDILV